MKFLRLILFTVLVTAALSVYLFGQQETASRIIVSESEIKRITEDRPVLSLWISVSGERADYVNVAIPYIISSEGERIRIDYDIEPPFADILPGTLGQLFNISFKASQIGRLESGTYTAVLVASSKNISEVKENISFEVKASVSAISFLNEKAMWIKENIFSLLFSLLEMIAVVLIIIILIRVFRNLFGVKKALRILSIVDETGKSSDYGGIASGIDDLLQSRIQDIINLINKSVVSRSALSGIKTQDEHGIGGRSSNINILKGSEDIDPQKIGDLGVGILKIPLGSLITVISKMFGGTYITGALQKYGSINKLILTLEQRTFLSLRKKSVVLFEVSWESKDLADGLQQIIRELAYKIIIHLSEDINTYHWKAYKYFLDGNVFFSQFEENSTRKDILRDAISCWRESVRIDPKFAEAHYNLGVALDRDNKISDALFRYDRAVEFGSDQTKAKAYTNMARVYIQDIKDPEIARELINKAKILNPSNAELWNLEGLIFLNKQQDTEAAACFQKAIDLNKNEIKRNNDKAEPVYYYNLSVANYYLKNYAVAESSGLNAYGLYPETSKPIYLLQTLGLIYNMKNEHEKGLRYFEEGLLKEPENRDMLDGYSTALFYFNKQEESFAVQRRLLRLHPEYYNGYLNVIRVLKFKNADEILINIYQDLGEMLRTADFNSALKTLQENYDFYGEDTVERKVYSAVLGGIFYYVRPDYVKSAEYLSAASAEDNSPLQKIFLPEILLTYGMAFIKSYDYKSAINCLTRAVPLFNEQQNYDLAICYENLAEAYKYLNMNIDADSAYSNAIFYYRKVNLVAVASETYAKRASWLTTLKYYKEAEADCDQAVYLNRLNYNAYHYKGNIRYNSLNEEDAIPQYEHSVEIFYDVPGTHYTMGLCHFYLGNYEEAVKKFQTTLKLKDDYAGPDDMSSPDAYQRLAITWESLGNFQSAEGVLKKAVNLFPRKVKYRLLLSRIYKLLNKYSDAERELNYCISLYETEPPNFKHLVLNELADIYLDYAVDYEAAFNHINEAVKILEEKKELLHSDKDDLNLLKSTLGWAYFRQKKYKEAEELLEKTLSAFIGNVKMHERIAVLYQKLSETETEESIKNEYKNKSVGQWRIVNKISSDDVTKKNAEEEISKLSK